MIIRISLAGLVFISLVVSGGSKLAAQDHSDHMRQAAGDKAVPLYDNLGSHTYAVTTRVPKVQDYFNQGMRLYYAFNHQEAIRSFKAAQELDPACAMCWWGEALAWGPNINLAMDSSSGVAAYAAINEALGKIDDETEKERALIEALSVRYDRDPEADRATLDSKYAMAMDRVVQRFPDDNEIIVLSGEAVMTQMPWDYWDEDKAPREGIAEALEGFERVMSRNPDHPGACHFYIHAVEKHYPERAVDCAEHLADLMPGAGHLVHMPGHIYIRIGRYADAIKVNEHAVHADETYIQDQRPSLGVYTAGYYPHNYDFLAFAASMIGRSEQSISAARKVHELVPAELLGQPGFTFLQHYSTRHLQLLVRFGKWHEILEVDAPDESLTHAGAMWHYARGRAFAATGETAAAREELDMLRQAIASPDLADVGIEFNKATDLLGIAAKVLSGWIEASDGDLNAAAEELRLAVAMEDKLLYGEPPEWTIPTRHDLGAVLLLADLPARAEQVYREDLDRFPKNGWSLDGLSRALASQGRTDEAAAVDGEFEKAWKGADFQIGRSALSTIE